MNWKIAGLAALGIGVSGCAGFAPTAPVSTSGYHLKAGTKTLDSASGTVLVSKSPTEMVLSGTVPDLKPGDVFISKLKGGGVRKVVSVTKSGGQTTVTTTQATLKEACSDLRLTMGGFGQAELGNVPTLDPGATCTWKKKSKGRTTSIGDVLSLKLGDVTFSDTMNLSGTVDIDFHPTFKADLSSGYLDVGFSPTIKGSITCQTSVTASWTLFEKKWVDHDFDEYYPDKLCPFIWITPHLTISSEVDGSIGGVFDSTISLDTSFVNILHCRGGDTWTDTGSIGNTTSAGVNKCEDVATLTLVPIKVKISFLVDSIYGPYGSIDFAVPLEADFVPNNGKGVSGVSLGINSQINAEVGLETSPGLATLLGITSSGAETVTWPRTPIYPTTFIPFASGVFISDEKAGHGGGDDIFDMTLDGSLVGPIGKGGNIYVDHLTPGLHVLVVKCIDPGSRSVRGNLPQGQLHVELTNAKFADGTTSFRPKDGEFGIGDSVALTILVGDPTPSHLRQGASPPRVKARDLFKSADPRKQLQ